MRNTKAKADVQKVSSRELWERALLSLPGGVSHDGRFMPPHPIYFDRALGARKWDVEGREYIDYAMGSAAMMVGHSHPDVVTALQQQAALGTFFATVHPLEIEWAELVQKLVPSAERVRFVASGTEATMLAFRVARAYTKRPKVLRFQGHFHGWHDYGVLGMKAPFDKFPTLGVPDEIANTVVVAPTDSNEVEKILKNDKGVGAIIVEPSGANWGSVPIPDQFLRDLRMLADRFNCLLIFDEIITGFRWSPGGKQALLNIKPDLTTMAKVVAGGMPGGALGGREEIMRLLNPNVMVDGLQPAVIHKGTFNGSPLVAAAAVATLKIIATEEPRRQANAIAERLRVGMQKILDELQVDALVYGEASTFHVYFDKGARKSRIHDISPESVRRLKRDTLDVYQLGLRSRGVDFMSYTGGLTSLAHQETDVAPTLDAFHGAIEDLIAANKVARL